MGEKILLVNDGLIVLVSQNLNILENISDIKLEIADYGAILTIEGQGHRVPVPFPCDILNHLEQSEGSNVYFYESSPYELIAEYRGCVTLDRDEILKIKGAYEYHQRL